MTTGCFAISMASGCQGSCWTDDLKAELKQARSMKLNHKACKYKKVMDDIYLFIFCIQVEEVFCLEKNAQLYTDLR